MRALLVQAAMENKLKHGKARLQGFCPNTAIGLEDDDYDDSEDD